WRTFCASALDAARLSPPRAVTEAAPVLANPGLGTGGKAVSCQLSIHHPARVVISLKSALVDCSLIPPTLSSFCGLHCVVGAWESPFGDNRSAGNLSSISCAPR